MRRGPEMKMAAPFTIRSKLTLIVMTTVGAALGLAIVAMVWFDLWSFSARIQQDAEMSALIMANNSRESLSMGAVKAATNTPVLMRRAAVQGLLNGDHDMTHSRRLDCKPRGFHEPP